MTALALSGQFCFKLLPKPGSIGVVYNKTSQYSTDQKLNLAAHKRGTGGRSSFNGIVATVFGNSGFVGRYLVNRLGKIGTQMILPHRCDIYDCMIHKPTGDLGQILFSPFDIRDEKSIETAVRYSNVVINLIGRDYETKNFKYDDVHVEGARTLARIARKAGVDRFIHLTYLNAEENPKPLVLKSPSRYKISKFFGEKAVREEFPDATIFRASDIYGNEDRFLNAIVTNWRRQLAAMPLYANGELTIKQPVYVGDVAQGIVNAARDPDTKGKVYQAVGPTRYLLCDLVDWFQGLMRKDAKWGYVRYDMKNDPLFAFKVWFVNRMSPAYPLGNLHWEQIERESTSDVLINGIPTLEDLGIKLIRMEDQVPWELRPYRAYQYYQDELGEFPAPPPPRVYCG